VAAALLGDVDNKGNLDADIAVLELDEAHAVHFVKAVPPRYSLLLNVMRDQLDRFGEIDTTAKLLASIALATEEAVVLNREDPRVSRIANLLKNQRVSYFGLTPKLAKLFPNDDDMRSAPGDKKPNTLPADVILSNLTDDVAEFQLGDHTATTSLQLSGVYNIYNAAAALALVRTVVKKRLG
jgi:UDP-N-acetylmuramyl pentapeptide synthase